jgi:hypothetical protein
MSPDVAKAELTRIAFEIEKLSGLSGETADEFVIPRIAQYLQEAIMWGWRERDAWIAFLDRVAAASSPSLDAVKEKTSPCPAIYRKGNLLLLIDSKGIGLLPCEQPESEERISRIRKRIEMA